MTDVVIVTGAAHGIGAATAARLSDAGYVVVAVDVDRFALDDVPGDVITIVGDVRDPSTARRAVDRATAAGRLHALINNAGTRIDRAFTSQTMEEWDEVTDTLLEGFRTMTRAVAAAMQREADAEMAVGPDARPSARAITSTIPATTVTASAGGSASAAGGGAVAALTRTLARELGGYGIRVNAVMVGYITTRMTAATTAADADLGLPEPVRQMASATTALGRFGTPAEVAQVHEFLVGPGAAYITGIMLPVTGGLLGT